MLIQPVTNILLILILVISLWLSSCLAVDKYLVSDASSDPDEFAVTRIGKIKIRNTTMIFKPANAINTFTGLQMLGIPIDRTYLDPKDYAYPFVYYEDYDFGRKSTPPYFILEVLFVVKDDGVLFHPGNVTLTVGENEFQPASYFRLEKRYRWVLGLSHVTHLCMAPGSYSASPDNPLEFASETNVNALIKLEKSEDYCFALKFETPPPDPRESFSIVVNDLIVDSKPFAFRITYKPGKYTERHA